MLISLWLVRLGYLGLVLVKDAAEVQALLQSGPSLADWPRITSLTHNLRQDVGALRAEAWPVTLLLRGLAGVSAVPRDVIALAPLLDLAADGLVVADETFTTLTPVLNRPSDVSIFVALAQSAQSHQTNLQAAQQAAHNLQQARAQIPAGLSPTLQHQLDRLDTLLPLLDPALALLKASPDLLGGHEPRTYLLLAQNSDELRASGGFISSVGVLTFDQGQMTLEVKNAYAIDDFANQAYPPPPIPLQRYMGADLWLFRDSNWGADFRSTARAAAGLYTLGQGQPVSGVIAFDQDLLQHILEATGPIVLEGEAGTVDAANLQVFMRTVWTPEPGDLSPEARTDSDSALRQLGDALLHRLIDSPETIDPVALVQGLRQSLDEKHLLIFFADSDLTQPFEVRGWSGALEPDQQDYLYIVDSNVGFNKVNAVLQRSIQYEVDLRHLSQPHGHLTIRYDLSANPPAECDQLEIVNHLYGTGDYASLTAGCYWNYLRVYLPTGVSLQENTPQPTPGEWLWSGLPEAGEAAIGAGTDTDKVGNVTEVSQFLVVPAGEALSTTFTYQLPTQVVGPVGSANEYCLQLAKQPGTQADPVSLSIYLPANRRVIRSDSQFVMDETGQLASLQTTLRTDQRFCLTFQ